MTDKIILISAVLLVIAAVITIGIVCKKQIDNLTASYTEKITVLEGSSQRLRPLSILWNRH